MDNELGPRGAGRASQPTMPRLHPGLWFDGRYQVIAKLGRGGMAEVYLAHDLVTTESVAVKVLADHARKSPELRRRLRYEREASAQVSHPNVMRVFGGGTAPGELPYLVAEVLQGETLRQRLRRERTVSPLTTVSLMRQAAMGLGAAHAEGVVHCDIKPSNLFLCTTETDECLVKVFDFGLACPAGGNEGSGSEFAAGTLQYMAPEQVVGDPVDPRADVYALGVVMFRALTGELPFDTTPVTELLAHQLLSVAPPSSWLVDALDPRIETIVLTAMRKHPHNRYASMADLLADLDRVLGDEPVLGVPLLHTPDEYVPQTESGRQVLRVLAQSAGPRTELRSTHASPPVSSVAPGDQQPALSA
ncbi:MAG: serine/threonine protein kinase [Polyangiaceae bacterium]|nr:serine/threonine protein kinase [Polyangiaceae bacterium]